MADQKNDQLYAMRHSLAHIMATAITTLWPEAKLGVGPVVENGFYYDIDIADVNISAEDFKRIEKEMRIIINQKQEFVRSEKLIDEALAWAEAAEQPYKTELLNDLKRSGTTVANDLDKEELGTISDGASVVEKVSFYTNGEFSDLCRGPHVENTGKVGAFKLMRVAGAYWRGKEGNPQMQRLYGVAFTTKEELNNHLQMLEEAKKRDHRKLGKDLDLFSISQYVGAGLPLFSPRGTVLRELLNDYSQLIRKRIGFEKVWTPNIAKKELYEISGHWEKFGDEWLTVTSQESSDELVMKPMNCPHHQQIYAAKPRSYKDLPIKYMETTTVYRDEKAGELLGLARVRAVTQDDSHAFCAPDQIKDVISSLVNNVIEFYKELGLPLKVRLSFRDDSDSYLGERSLWNDAQTILKEIIEDAGLEYYEEKGEAAFYGPKIDFMAMDALGREWQLATPQLDFVQPQRFGLKYADKDGQEKTPVMIHFAMMGSIERFLSAYLEHTAGNFPIWVSPEQIRIAPVNDSSEVLQTVNKITALLQKNSLRFVVDQTDDSVSKKIKKAASLKVPITLIIGDKEVESGDVSPRLRADISLSKDSYSFEDFADTIKQVSDNREL